MIRPRLLAALQQRFRSRLTVVVAGPGFGKTSLLAQARSENLLSPRGADVWLTCQAGDSAVSTLAQGLAAALALTGPPPWDPEAMADVVAAEVWRRSPVQVALVLDDAHLIPASSPGGQLLAAVLDRLPSNGHLLLGGRDPLPLPTARLAAQGLLVELGEADLAFTEPEIASFAELRRVPSHLLYGGGGWPALAELTASTGEHRVLDFLWEELLTRMPAERRRLLALLSVVGGADEEVAAALADRPVDLAQLLAGLPLVAGVAGTWRSLHPLWGPALSRELSDADVAAARHRVAEVLLRRGDLDTAVRLLAQARSWDAVGAAVCDTAKQTHPLVAPDVLAEWFELLPADYRERAEGRLLRALVERSRNLASALRLFADAATEFRAAGKVAGEIAALTHVAHISWWLDDQTGLEAAVGRIAELAARFPVLDARAALGQVLLADARADFRRAVELLATRWAGPAGDAAIDSAAEWLWAWELLLLGEPERAEPHAELAVARAPGTFRATGVNVKVLSAWLSGQVEEALADLPVFTDATNSTGRALGLVFERSQCALLLAFTGDVAAAREHLAVAWAALPGADGAPKAQIAHVLAEAALETVEGDESAARDRLAAELAARPLTNEGRTRLHRLFPALSYVLLPQARPYWDAATLGPVTRTAVELAAAVVAVRERGSLAEAEAVDLPAPGQVRALLPLPWAVELAVALTAAGRPEAPSVLAVLGQLARPHLKAIAAGGHRRLAAAARELGAALPPTPRHHVELQVLGPLRLLRDGTPVDHPDLHRERVRQLLLYLVNRSAVSRAELAAELWPDLDVDAAARNLRVNLSYTQRLLEPDRGEGDPPYFLRSEDGMLRLRTDGSHLRVDAWQFDRLLDEAAAVDRQGAPSLALRSYRQALALYRGDYLADLPYAEWAAAERDRLRARYVTAAVRTGELLLAAGDHHAPLDLAHATLRVERWSESAYRLLIAAHLERGELDAARMALERCERMLDELDATPNPQTQIVARRLRTSAAGGVRR